MFNHFSFLFCWIFYFYFLALFCFGFSVLALAVAYLLNFDSPCHCFLLHTPLKVYTVNNVSVITKIRTEHLTEEEKKRYKGNLFPSPRPPHPISSLEHTFISSVKLGGQCGGVMPSEFPPYESLPRLTHSWRLFPVVGISCN